MKVEERIAQRQEKKVEEMRCLPPRRWSDTHNQTPTFARQTWSGSAYPKAETTRIGKSLVVAVIRSHDLGISTGCPNCIIDGRESIDPNAAFSLLGGPRTPNVGLEVLCTALEVALAGPRGHSVQFLLCCLCFEQERGN